MQRTRRLPEPLYRSRRAEYNGVMNQDLIFRPYQSEKDEKDVIRVWKECGWMDMKKSRKSREAFRDWLSCGTADVVEFRGAAECLVTTHRGSIELLETTLPFRAISGVTVGRPLRRMGGAGELTARAVAAAAETGDVLAGLGIFDQGFYNRLGFGNFPYTRHISFDPLTLKVPPLKRSPVRLSKKDLGRIHSSTRSRMRHHGLVRFEHEDFTRLILAEHGEGFGLGFEDSEGTLTHHFWAMTKGESGPYQTLWMVFRNYSELMELLSLIRNLGDQVNSFTVREPWGLQMQDLLSRPFRNQEITEGGKFENRIRSSSFKQARILDMPETLKALKLPGGSVAFNLNLEDPISGFLPENAPWRGIGGPWTIEMEESGSEARPGHSDGLPVMTASVNAFTRLVFGVATPSGLAATDRLKAPESLLRKLDDRLKLPVPDMVQIF